MIEVKILSEVWVDSGGVYIIRFSDGHFYIGCSGWLKGRIRAHVGAAKSGFTSKSTCKPLQKMKGFVGFVEIALLEAVDSSKREGSYGADSKIVEREVHYLRLYAGNPMLLNSITTQLLVQTPEKRGNAT